MKSISHSSNQGSASPAGELEPNGTAPGKPQRGQSRPSISVLLGPVRRVLGPFRSNRARQVYLTLLLLGAALLLGWVRHLTHPMKGWMAPTYIAAWCYTCLFHSACLVAGWQCLRLVVGAPPRVLERVVFAHALGYLLFYLAMFALGIIGAYQPVLFWLLPLAMLGSGMPNFVADTRRLYRRHARGGIGPLLPGGLGEALALSLIVVSLVAIYVQILTPDNICYDSRWYHLPIAEQYVAAGRIIRFDDGWYLGAYPQMASLTYAWAMLAPGGYFEHLVLCAHIEYSLLPWTLLGFAAMAARIAGRGRYLYAGAVLFLFPSLFIYDSSFVTNADHILAYWVAPLTVALVRFGKRFELREALLAAAFTGAAICVKYQSCMLFVPIAVYLGWLVLRHRRLLPAFLWTATVAAITSTHWLKNLVYYHDPFFPILNQIFPSKPFFHDAVALYRQTFWDPYFIPKGHGWKKVVDGLWAALTFPLTRFARPILTNAERPVIGALFTVLLPTIFFLRHRLRLLTLAAAVYLGALVWYFTSHQDRYIQGILPWMAVVVALVVAQLWQLGLLVRSVTVGLVALQLLIVFSGYFTPSHAMTGGPAIKAAVEFLGRPYSRSNEAWNTTDGTMEALHAELPDGAKVLVHSMRLRAGLRVMSLTDEPGWQGAIEYLDLDSPDRVASLWRSMGVTHVITKPDSYRSEPPFLARELVYARALHHTTAAFGDSIGGWQIRTLKNPSSPDPAAELPTRIGWLVCNSPIRFGIYEPRDIDPNRLTQAAEVTGVPAEQVINAANALIVRGGCSAAPDRSSIAPMYSLVLERDEYQLWIRQ
jgi:hypothetical protein